MVRFRPTGWILLVFLSVSGWALLFAIRLSAAFAGAQAGRPA